MTKLSIMAYLAWLRTLGN